MHVLFQKQQDAALQNYPLTETLYVLRCFDSFTACGIIILFAGIRPCQFNFLFNLDLTNPIILLIPPPPPPKKKEKGQSATTMLIAT